MEEQFILQKCAELAEQLLTQLEEDLQDIPRCVNGEILEAYRRGADEAQQSVLQVQEGIRKLRWPD